MRKKNRDLHGSAPDKSDTALLMIDIINALDFPEASQMLPYAEQMAQKILTLKKRARKAGVPVIYVNDNFGRWQSNFTALIRHCMRQGCLGRKIVARLKPQKQDYFVLKPKHSGFYSTTLDTLLEYLEVKKLIITGIAANICVLFTANDAYMRDFELIIPADCVVSNTAEENEYALTQMKKVLKANIQPSSEIRLSR
jgi:nicotinamidase-related amidase